MESDVAFSDLIGVLGHRFVKTFIPFDDGLDHDCDTFQCRIKDWRVAV